jgi:hypothetical protein
LETCCGYEYDQTREPSHSLGFSRAVEDAPDPTKDVELYQPSNPSSERIDFRVSDCQGEKKTLPGALAGVSKFIYVAVQGSASWFRNVNRIPFR